MLGVNIYRSGIIFLLMSSLIHNTHTTLKQNEMNNEKRGKIM